MEKFHKNSIKINAREPQRLNNRMLYSSIVDENVTPSFNTTDLIGKIVILTSIANTYAKTTTSTNINQVNINLSFVKFWCLGNWCF